MKKFHKGSKTACAMASILSEVKFQKINTPVMALNINDKPNINAGDISNTFIKYPL